MSRVESLTTAGINALFAAKVVADDAKYALKGALADAVATITAHTATLSSHTSSLIGINASITSLNTSVAGFVTAFANLTTYNAAASGIALTLNANWTGNASYARRSGNVVVSFNVTPGTSGVAAANQAFANLPAGFRPPLSAIYTMGIQSGTTIRRMAVTADGNMASIDATTVGGGIIGSFTFPAA